MNIAMKKHSLVLLACIAQASYSAGIRYRKMASPSDSNFGYLFTRLGSVAASSTIDCAAMAGQLTTLANRTARASAFLYFEGNSTCVLGRSPAFDGSFMQSQVDLGQVQAGAAFAIVGKPIASAVNNDTFFYALLNEEQSEYFSHPSFVMAWPNGTTPAWSAFSYSVPSPVVSFGGQLAATFNGAAYLKFDTPSVIDISELTILAWYNSATYNPNAGIVSLCYADTSYSMEFWISSGVNPNVAWNGFPLSPGQALPAGKWTYVGFTFSRALQSFNFWRNATAYYVGSASPVPNPKPVYRVTLGQNCMGNARLTGAVASVEIYLRPLNASDVQTAMAKSVSGRTSTGQLPN